VCLVGLFVFFLMVGMGQGGGETILDNWLLTGPILVALVTVFFVGEFTNPH
jgi:hypothetical protein